MIPAHIKAILDQHGGADGDPTPVDSGGLITYRATDGAWVVASANGDIVSQGSSPGVVTSGPQAAPVKTGVGSYTQAELEARLAQSPGLVYGGQKQKMLPGAYGRPPSPVAVVSWKDPKTNEILEAQVDPEGGTYTVTQDGPGGKNPPATTRAADPNAPVTGSNPRVPPGSTSRIEGTPTGPLDAKGNPTEGTTFDNSTPVRAWHLPDGSTMREPVQTSDADYLQWQKNKNGGLTDAEVAQRQQKDDTTPTDVSYTGTGKGRTKVTTYASGRKATEASPTTATAVSATYQTRDGKPAKVTKYDDGTETVEEQKPTVGQVIKGGGEHGEDIQAIPDPSTGVVGYQPIPGAQVPAANRPMPAGTPSFTPDPSDPNGDYGITKYGQQLRQFQSVHPELTNDMARGLITDAGEVIKTVDARSAREQQQASTTRSQDLTQRTQDLGEVQSRRSSADTGYDTLFRAMEDSAPHLGRGNGHLASEAFRAELLDRQAYARQAGGYADVAPVGPPPSYLRTTTIHPDGTTVISHPVAAPSAAATNAVAGGVTATTAAAADPSGANVQAANDATMQGSQAAFGAAGAPSVMPTAAPSIVQDGAPSALAPSLGPPPSYLQAPPPQWSHDDTVAELRARGIPDDAIREGLALHYAGYGSAA